jgi:hypothetical protein
MCTLALARARPEIPGACRWQPTPKKKEKSHALRIHMRADQLLEINFLKESKNGVPYQKPVATGIDVSDQQQ